ncbi:uncharacterized protein V1518DRAFT_415593 [Limtongia smithiae]|uniref:uncharacterized protein n=1 Tax=Limtongia smithiae TaxID=1125753 RepID=UPI0034CE60D8
MAQAALFTNTVMTSALLMMASTSMSTDRDMVIAFIKKQLAAIQTPDMPLPYACRNFPDKVFSQIPEGIFPEEFEYTTHLALLRIFGDVRDSIECTDGLFGIWDKDMPSDDQSSSKFSTSAVLEMPWSKKSAALTAPELRWKVYVARAVERYRRWFDALPKSQFSVRLRFVGGSKFPMDYGTLLPIDVLMVWHAHMLHPQEYWEDCIRTCRSGIFSSMPFPWLAISHAIGYADNRDENSEDPKFQYVPPAVAHSNFLRMTQCDFENETDAITMTVTCASCRRNNIPVDWWNKSHTGWAEEGFTINCVDCGSPITKDRLSVLQFFDDFAALSCKGIFMKGTILDYFGMADSREIPVPGFPNLILGRNFRISRLTFDDIDGTSYLRRRLAALVNNPSFCGELGLRTPLGKDYDYSLREMFMKYDGNPGPFGLDLEAGVHEIATFTDTMNALAYYRSPFRSRIINRTSDRFLQFLFILCANPGKDLAPSCDIDFAWHTMLLNPAAYMATGLLLTGAPINHVDTNKPSTVSDAARFAARAWKKTFTLDSQGIEFCTCVYCEAEREFAGERGSSSSSNNKRGNPQMEARYIQACAEARKSGSQPIARRVRMGDAEPFAHPYTAPSRKYDNASGNRSATTKHTTVVDVKNLKCIMDPRAGAVAGETLAWQFTAAANAQGMSGIGQGGMPGF